MKARQEQVGRDEISSFIATLRTHDRGLFVSLGGFSRAARDEADRSNQPLTLLDMDDFVELLLRHYDDLEVDARDLVPARFLPGAKYRNPHFAMRNSPTAFFLRTTALPSVLA